MNILIIGFGSIGKRHVRLLLERKNTHIWLFRTGLKQNPFGLPEIRSWSECKSHHFDSCFITNPTSLHVKTAIEAMKYLRCPLFIEKPLDSSLLHVNTLNIILKKSHITAYVAYVLRFHPVIQALKAYFDRYTFLTMRVVCSSYLPLWRSGVDWKTTYSAHRDMGGGVLLDLSHEFDYTQYLLGSITSLNGFFSRISDLTKDAEDIAEVFCYTPKGMVTIHMDFISQKKERTLTIYFKEMTIFADLNEGTIEEWINEKRKIRNQFKVNLDDIHRAQHAYFFNNMYNPNIMNSVSEATPLLTKIISFKKQVFHEK